MLRLRPSLPAYPSAPCQQTDLLSGNDCFVVVFEAIVFPDRTFAEPDLNLTFAPKAALTPWRDCWSFAKPFNPVLLAVLSCSAE